MARLPRHAAEPGAGALPEGRAERPQLEQVSGLDGDRGAAAGARCAAALACAAARALWAEERNTAEAAVRIAVADENGYDGATLQAMEQSAEVLAVYRANSAEAVELGVFGAPTFILGDERFWGQDRLGFLDRALDKLRAVG
ncbi:DsbA family protein [Variovorax sp. UC122_21]|uniref:DsbA family protein n=1 Tax=Variovorax sp. UC122_21 TaxID=3374554 RepID=UPI003756551D